jgi:hypothetical protein
VCAVLLGGRHAAAGAGHLVRTRPRVPSSAWMERQRECVKVTRQALPAPTYAEQTLEVLTKPVVTKCISLGVAPGHSWLS